MIAGNVNDDLEATIELVVRDSQNQTHRIAAVIDTGFNGFLTLSPTLIARLGLPWVCRQEGMLVDGSIQIFDVHAANVEWDGKLQVVEADAADGVPLVGMRMMLNQQFQIQVRPLGLVAVTAMA